MEIIKIGNLEVKCNDFGQVEWNDIYAITKDWQDGWRLPNKEELELIYDFKIKNGIFHDKYYWSSNYFIENMYSSGAWVKHFGNGLTVHFGVLFQAYVLGVKNINDKECFMMGTVELSFCDGIELLSHDFGLVDWSGVENILDDLGENWRVPTIEELHLIKPYKLNIGGISGDYYWGLNIENGEELPMNLYFGDNYINIDKRNEKNNLFVVRSGKRWQFTIPEGKIII